MNTIQRNHPKANREVGAAHKFADGLNGHANSEVPSIAPRSIHDQLTETISLSEQLLDEWNHRLKNNLQILVGLLESGYRKARDPEAREVLSDAIRRIGAIGTAQRAYYYARGSTDVNGQDLVNAVCVRQVNMTISLAFVAPDLVRAAVEGRLPRGIGVERLRDAPAEWSRQFETLGLNPQ